MQEKSDRGLICIEAEYQSVERAQMDGYSYAWFDHKLNCQLMCKHTGVHSMTFAKIVGWE